MHQIFEDICGYRVLAVGRRACANDIISWIKAGSGATKFGKGRWLACLNPHSYAVSLNDKQFSAALGTADWLIPDGSGVVIASKILGGNIRERVTGSDIFYSINRQLDEIDGTRVFFLGSTNKVLAELAARMEIDYPNITVAGTFSPPFKPDYSQNELDEMVGAVNAAAPDVLWVGMTAPKQEKWVAETMSRLDVRFVAAIGAVFDFYIGNIKRSHPVFQRLGLEWLPRLLREPQRLWRRMFVSAPIFMWHVIKARFGYHSAK